ncbi:MAG: EAL domain-containing protein, partial [Alphaproteobacteria bacterium]
MKCSLDAVSARQRRVMQAKCNHYNLCQSAAYSQGGCLAATWSGVGAVREFVRGHMRMGAVVPIGVIAALAFVAVIIAVVSAAHRADEAALETERNLFARALASRRERLLRELESVARSEDAKSRILVNFDPAWAHAAVSSRLQSAYDHDFVFIADPADRIIYSSPNRRSIDPVWPLSIHAELQGVLDVVRSRGGWETGSDADHGRRTGSPPQRAAQMQTFLGAPAIVGAVPVVERSWVFSDADAGVPVIVSVKFIDAVMLADIASRLQLRNLRKHDLSAAEPGDHLFSLTSRQGNLLALFAWIPAQPGAEMVRRVIPFIGLAVAASVLLGALILGHMRSTAATICAAETRLRHLALHDPLCGLPNRIFFGERLEAMIEKVRQGKAAAAVFYIDLDHFKDVNDTLGHPVGDDLLRGVAQRLARTLRDEDLVTRLGGDEFAVIIPGGFDHGTLHAMAARMIAAICAPYSIANQSIVIGASVGIVVISGQEGAADVMRHADLALYRAKNEGRNRACIFDSAMDADLVKRKLLEHELRVAIETGGLNVVYQPIVNASGKTIIGVEALCRWTHPERGEIPPSEFIPVAEHSGLIIALGEQVLLRACQDGKMWPDLTVAVNVSALQFRRPDLVDVVERIVSAADFDPARLELEVTESTVLGNVDTVELAMFRLKALGVRLALDDFGTGYSSLLYLRRFPFDKLKIDSSFVRSIERAADAAAIVHAVVSLGRGLGMKVTAEGVETADQQLFLRAAGVHYMQGYRF